MEQDAGDELIAAEVLVSEPVIKNNVRIRGVDNDLYTKEAEVSVNLSSMKISDEDKKYFEDASTFSNWLTRTDETMNAMGNIKERLSVDYQYSTDIFSDAILLRRNMKFDYCKITVFCGDSEKEFNRVRSILEKNDIRYKYKVVDHEQNTWLPCRGTTRSLGGDFTKAKPIYEVFVSKKDYELAYLKLYK